MRGKKSIEATLGTLTMTSADELKTFNAQLGEHLNETPPNIAGLLEVLQTINKKHVAIQMLQESGYFPKSNLHKVANLHKPPKTAATPAQSGATDSSPDSAPMQIEPSAAELEVSQMAQRVKEVSQMAQRVKDRLRTFAKKRPRAFKPVAVDVGEDRIKLALAVPRTHGDVLSAFEWRIKLSSAPKSGWSSYQMLPEADWQGKPAGMEFTFVVESAGNERLQSGTAYDVAVHGKSDEALETGASEMLANIQTVAARALILESDLKDACKGLQGLLDNNQVLMFSASAVQTVRSTFELLRRSIVPVPLMRTEKVRKVVSDVAQSTRSLIGDEETAFAAEVPML